jgi:hypothetical protein
MSKGSSSDLSLPSRRRTATAVLLITLVIGIVGLHILTGWDWIKSTFYVSMIALGEGPSFTLPNDASLLFITVMAFLSIGALVTIVVTVVGPLFRKWIAQSYSLEGKLGRDFRRLEERLDRMEHKNRASEETASTVPE